MSDNDRLPFEFGMLSRDVIQHIEDEARANTDNGTVMAMQELKRLRVLLCWAYRQREGHINCAPQWYDHNQGAAWVNGWDKAFDRFWETFNDHDLSEAVPPEDLQF